MLRFLTKLKMTTTTESGGRQNMYPTEVRPYLDESYEGYGPNAEKLNGRLAMLPCPTPSVSVPIPPTFKSADPPPPTSMVTPDPETEYVDPIRSTCVAAAFVVN